MPICPKKYKAQSEAIEHLIQVIIVSMAASLEVKNLYTNKWKSYGKAGKLHNRNIRRLG